MATDLQYREGLTDTQKNQLVTRLDRIKAGSAITDTDKANFNYGLGTSWESYLGQNLNYDGLGKTPTPATPTPQPDPTQAFMNGLAGANTQNQAQLTEQQKRLQESQKLMKDAQMLQGVNPDQTAYDQRMTKLEEAYKGTMGKGEAYKQQLEQAGVPEAQKRLADLNILMAQQQAAFQQGMLDTEGKVIPMRFITGQQAQMQKQYAVTAGNTAMMAQALQGNITMAKQTAMDTVDLEYADREAELNMQKQMLELNYDKLTKSEQKRADELNFILDQEAKRLEEEKIEKQSKYDLAISALENGADQATVSKIMNSKDLGSAIMAMGGSLAQKAAGGAPVKIGTDSKGKDIYWVEGYGAVSGDQLLGINGGGPEDILFESYDPEAYEWATSIRDGKSKLDEIQSNPELRTKVVTMLNSLPPSPKAVSDAEKMIADLKTLYNPETGEQHPGMDSAVGPALTGFFSRTWLSEPFTGGRSGFLGTANQIVSKKALDALIEAKSKGATFGALSDREMALLRAAATKLGSWEMLDDEGNVKGYKTTEENVRKEIGRLITDYQTLVNEAKKQTEDPAKLFPRGSSGTPTATLNKVLSFKDGEKGGQCGRFVNRITGLGLGDSYASKMAKMDRNLQYPEPGMVFVTPYKDTGHTGFIVAVNNDGTVTVKDSNASLDEKIRTRKIPITKITGLARV